MTELTIRGIEEALAHGGYTHTIGDVVHEILSGRAQLHQAENALIVTEIQTSPQVPLILHFWLATGELEAVKRLSHEVLEWGKRIGCKRATFTGRAGWVKALAEEGWRRTGVTMAREM